jgi:cytochrome c
MRHMRAAVLALFALSAVAGAAFAGAAEDSIARGKDLFKDRKAFGGFRACDSCHPGGKGLEKAEGKKRFVIMGRQASSLEDAINLCIENANKGAPIAVDSQEMKDLVNYIKSL